jgi:hypothetical protein
MTELAKHVGLLAVPRYELDVTLRSMVADRESLNTSKPAFRHGPGQIPPLPNPLRAFQVPVFQEDFLSLQNFGDVFPTLNPRTVGPPLTGSLLV